MARREKQADIQELERRGCAYFDGCDAAGRRYTRPGLLVALGIDEETAQAWLADRSGKRRGEAEVLRRGLLRVVDDLEQREDAKSLFLLKQPCYGGYRDKPEEGGKGGAVDVRVCFQGADFGK